MAQLILVRHGQSQWNLENRFTGWVDSPLTDKGVQEAVRAGVLMDQAQIEYQWIFCSVLQRAIKTLWLILEERNQMWMPVEKNWRLNERHYGGLQGLNKKETAAKHGDEQVFQWRRSYDIPPPPASGPHQAEQLKDSRYRALEPKLFPSGESLKNTVDRVEPYWDSVMSPRINEKGSILVAAHGNSLRALVKILADISDQEITKFEFPTGVPLVCDLNDHKKITNMNFLDSQK